MLFRVPSSSIPVASLCEEYQPRGILCHVPTTCIRHMKTCQLNLERLAGLAGSLHNHSFLTCRDTGNRPSRPAESLQQLHDEVAFCTNDFSDLFMASSHGSSWVFDALDLDETRRERKWRRRRRRRRRGLFAELGPIESMVLMWIHACA